jgi:hypothetical protein
MCAKNTVRSSGTKAVDLLRMPPQVHLMQDVQVTEVAFAILQVKRFEMPLYAIIIGVPLKTLEARSRLSCSLDVFLGGAEFALPRRHSRPLLRLPLASWW